MTQRFRLALVGLVALAALTAALWLLQGPAPGSGTEPLGGRPGGGPGDGRESDGRGQSLEGRGPGSAAHSGSGEPPGSEPGAAGGASGGLRPGLRPPSGVDLSDPAQRRTHLLALLAAKPIPWEDVAAVVSVTTEPLDPAVKEALLAALRAGDRNGVSKALIVANDPALVPELLAVLDDAASAVGARRVALMALSQMPGAVRDELVKQLEARLKGSGPADGELLGAIARRGGAEAARAVTEYLARSPDAARLALSVAGQLDVVADPEAAAVVAEAFAGAKSPEALEALVRLASARPGASALAAPLIALDRDDVPEALRTQVIEALAQIGTEESTDHLLRLARQPGAYGEKAQLALGNLRSATPKAREALLAELDRSALNPRAELARSTLLEAVGTLGMKEALPVVVQALSERSDRVKNSAVRSLGRMRQLGRPHVAELGGLWSGGSPVTRTALAVALGSIGGPDAAQLLEEWVKDPAVGPELRRTLSYAADQARGNPGADGAEPGAQPGR